MSRWCRLYESVLHDPKVQRLPGETFKGLINLWCLASASDGVLPPIEDIAFALRTTESKAQALIDHLHDVGLLDVTDDGLQPHNWNGRQFKSDVSTNRVRQFRERKKDVPRNSDETFRETPLEQSRAETESERKKASLRSGKKSAIDELQPTLDAEHARAVIEHRQKIRKPLTPHAAKLLAGKFAKCPNPNEAADAMIANGWQGFEPDWVTSRSPSAQSGEGVPDWDARLEYAQKNGWRHEWGDKLDIPADYRERFKGIEGLED